MNNRKEEVSIRIEALDSSGAVVPIQMVSNKIQPGQNPDVLAINTILNIDLVKEVGVDPIDCEIFLEARHDIMDHALVVWNDEFVSQKKLLVHEKPEDPIRSFQLPIPGIRITLFARTDIPNLTLTHPEIAGYRFTRVNPAKSR